VFNIFSKKQKTSTETRTVGVASRLFGWLFNADGVNNYLTIGSVYACIRMIADSVAMTPLKVYMQTKKGREPINNTLSKLLENPASNVTGFMWINTMLTQLVGWGNAYSVIVRENGVVKELLYIPTSSVSIQLTYELNDPFYYRVALSNNTFINVFPDDMLHFKNISLDGIVGESPIALHKTTFDTSHNQAQYADNFVKNGAGLSGIITTEKGLKREQVEQLKQDFKTAYMGSENAGSVPVLGDGMKFEQLKPISPQDADYVASKKLTKSEILEIFKVPPPLLGIIDATYSNTEQLALIYQRYTLTPIYEMIQQELKLKLLSSSQQNLIIEFMVDALLTTTAKDKVDVITKLTEKGVMTLNEARRRYNLIDEDGLNEVVLPLNSAPMTLHNKVLDPQIVAPTETVTPPEPDDDELRSLVHKLQSELGRLKKDFGQREP